MHFFLFFFIVAMERRTNDMKTTILYPASYDVVFKALLASCRRYLIALLHEILNYDEEELRKYLSYRNVEYENSRYHEKRKVSDLLVDFQNDSIILEMNRTYYKGLLRKNYDYIFKGYNLLYHRGESYQIKKRMIQINFDLKPFSCFPKGYEEKVIRDVTILDRKDGFSHQDIIIIYHII